MAQDTPTALESRERADDARLHSPSAARNKEPVLAVLRAHLPVGARVLEVGSGTGEHAVHFAAHLDRVVWQPSEQDPDAFASTAAWVTHAGLAGLRPPVRLDVCEARWPVEDDAPFQAVLSLNMIHIAPWAAAEGLVAGAARVLTPSGALMLYGPFAKGGVHSAPSNAAFDESLKARNPAWGVRDLDQVEALAQAHGFALRAVVSMPAHNLTVIFHKSEGTA